MLSSFFFRSRCVVSPRYIVRYTYPRKTAVSINWENSSTIAYSSTCSGRISVWITDDAPAVYSERLDCCSALIRRMDTPNQFLPLFFHPVRIDLHLAASFCCPLHILASGILRFLMFFSCLSFSNRHSSTRYSDPYFQWTRSILKQVLIIGRSIGSLKSTDGFSRV